MFQAEATHGTATSTSISGWATCPGIPWDTRSFPEGPRPRTEWCTIGSALKPSSFNWPGNNYNWGRSGTHEVGHWLGLKHTFEGGCHTNCSTQGDLVCDTPPVFSASFNCPSFPKISCGNGPNGGMFMNYMDYVDDNCMFMFTNGQVSRMDSFVNGFRMPLIASPGCAVGIGESKSAFSISITPNPANNGFTILHYGIVHGTVALYNGLGQLIFIENLDPLVTTVPTSGLAAGIYLLKIRTVDGPVARKVMIRR
jgi:hypothetical protein